MVAFAGFAVKAVAGTVDPEQYVALGVAVTVGAAVTTTGTTCWAWHPFNKTVTV